MAMSVITQPSTIPTMIIASLILVYIGGSPLRTPVADWRLCELQCADHNRPPLDHHFFAAPWGSFAF
jgi:hypothetical protein